MLLCRIHNVVTIDKQYEKSSNNEKPNLEPTQESSDTYQNSSISKETLPSFSKILITNDGKDESIRYLTLPRFSLTIAINFHRYTN